MTAQSRAGHPCRAMAMRSGQVGTLLGTLFIYQERGTGGRTPIPSQGSLIWISGDFNEPSLIWTMISRVQKGKRINLVTLSKRLGHPPLSLVSPSPSIFLVYSPKVQ